MVRKQPTADRETVASIVAETIAQQAPKRRRPAPLGPEYAPANQPSEQQAAVNRELKRAASAQVVNNLRAELAELDVRIRNAERTGDRDPLQVMRLPALRERRTGVAEQLARAEQEYARRFPAPPSPTPRDQEIAEKDQRIAELEQALAYERNERQKRG